MDKKLANNFLVGAFVLLGVVGFVFVLFNIGDGKGFLSSQYTLHAKFADVKGLHYGSEVALSGLRVGVVKKIQISKEDGKLLVLDLSIGKSMKEHIRRDSTAAIRTQGMLGDKYIELTIGSKDQPPLEDGEFIVSSDANDLLKKGGELVDNVNKQFSEGGDFDSLMKSLNKVSSNLAAITTEVRTSRGLLNEMIYGDSGAKLNNSLANLESILRKINNGEGTLGAIINDPTLYEDVKYMMGGAKRSNVLKYFMRSFIDSGAEAEDEKKKPKPKAD